MRRPTRGWLAPAAVYRFFRACSRGDTVVVMDPDGRDLAVLPFMRQQRDPRACAADWVRAEPEAFDTVALFIVTAGSASAAVPPTCAPAASCSTALPSRRSRSRPPKAAAEWLHRRLRGLWAFPDSPR